MTLKTIIIILMSLVAMAVQSQDTTYYNDKYVEVENRDLCAYFQVVEYHPTDTNKVLEREFFQSGQIKSEKYYNPYNMKTIVGKNREWFDNGQIKSEVNYNSGKLNGLLQSYYKSGQLKRKDIY